MLSYSLCIVLYCVCQCFSFYAFILGIIVLAFYYYTSSYINRIFYPYNSMLIVYASSCIDLDLSILLVAYCFKHFLVYI